MRRNLSANVVNRKYGVRWKSDGKHRQKQKLEAAGGIDKIQTQIQIRTHWSREKLQKLWVKWKSDGKHSGVAKAGGSQ